MTNKHIYVLTLATFALPAYSQITLNAVPERAIGTPQLTVTSFGPNLVEGREFYAPQSVALDTSVTPNIIYVSDYVNNRVLAWKNASGFTNGQPADLAIGQPDGLNTTGRSLITTFPQGPSSSTSTVAGGLSHPSGLAVDANGNLYVADAGNNRILRYPKPFAQTGQYPFPNLAIGQVSYTKGSGADYPNGQVSAQGLGLSSGSTYLISSLTFDSSGNLWVVDTGNDRVLAFKASDLASSANGALSAFLVIGQPDFATQQTALNPNTTTSFHNLTQLISPTCIGFDPSGNLFVGDFNRVLVFNPPFSNGMSASSHILGVFPTTFVPPTTQSALNTLLNTTTVYGPSGIFFLSGGAGVGVVDAAWNRIMIFPPFASWAADGTPPTATSIVGQPATTICPTGVCTPNSGSLTGPSASVFSAPAGVAYTGSDLYLADAGNNRVLDLPQQGSTFSAATRVLGQDSFNTGSPNLIEGREFRFQGSFKGGTFADADMVVDNSTGTPHLYVSDPYNNRILGYKDLRKFQNGGLNKADIVLGQGDFTTAMINYPTGDANQPTSSSLYRPIGLIVDSTGNLYVADSGNGRVLRFPTPFSYTGSAPQQADLVLGQQSFTSAPDSSASTTTMGVPYGLAFTPSCNILTPPCPAPNGLLVSDQQLNRVLYIPTTNGTFRPGLDNDKPATIVFGQPNFNSSASGSSLSNMNGPHHISCDAQGYVYVADSANNRILIFADPHQAGTPSAGESATPAVINNLNGPEGVFVSPVTGEIWVANTGSGTSLRFANYQSVLLGNGSINGITEASNNIGFHTLAVIQDQYGDLFVADDADRIAFYYPGLSVQNAASYQSIATFPLAPGTFASAYPCQGCEQFPFSAQFSSYPIPETLGDLQVFVNGTPSPVTFVIPNQINFILPNNAPQSGIADLEVVQASTGQILGAAQVPMSTSSPGAFECGTGTPVGSVQTIFACAINADGTINSASNPAQHGKYVSLYMTGQGNVPNAPPDGVPATTAINAQYPITVILNGFDVNSAFYGESSIQHVLYSGLNGYPGMWQINLLIPNTVVTTSPVYFDVLTSNGLANWTASTGFRTYIYVK